MAWITLIRDRARVSVRCHKHDYVRKSPWTASCGVTARRTNDIKIACGAGSGGASARGGGATSSIGGSGAARTAFAGGTAGHVIRTNVNTLNSLSSVFGGRNSNGVYGGGNGGGGYGPSRSSFTSNTGLTRDVTAGSRSVSTRRVNAHSKRAAASNSELADIAAICDGRYDSDESLECESAYC